MAGSALLIYRAVADSLSLSLLALIALLARSPISFDVGKNFSAFDDVDFSAAAQQPDDDEDGDQDVCVLGVTQKVKIVA